MLKAINLSKSYIKNGKQFYAVKSVNLSLPNYGFVSIVGESGSGKTTFVSLLSCLLKPTSGSILLNGEPLDSSNCLGKISHLFQEHNLIEDLTCFDNLSLVSKNKEDISKALQKLGLSGKERRKVSTLSGGEKQRCAIARCYLGGANILILDEPTANLDSENAKSIFHSLKTISKTKLVIVVTHDRTLSDEFADRIFEMHHGELKTLENAEDPCENQIGQAASDIRKTRKIPFRFTLKFLWKNLWAKPGKTVASLLFSGLSLSLTLLLTSLSFFNLGASLSNAISESNNNFIGMSLKSEGLPSATYKLSNEKFHGLSLYQSALEEGTRANAYLFPYENGMTIQGRPTEEPAYGSCFTTEFLSAISKGSLSFSLGQGKFDNLKIQSTFPVPDLDTAVEAYESSKDDFESSEQSSVTFSEFSATQDYFQNYAFVILNRSEYENTMSNLESVVVNAADFLLPYYADDITYATRKTTYSAYSDQTLSIGSKPATDGDVIISEGFFNRHKNLLGAESAREIIGASFSYRDLSSSGLESDLPFCLLFDQIKITGVSSSSAADVYMSPSDYRKITSEYCFKGSGFCLYNDDADRIGQEFAGNLDIRCGLQGAQTAYFLQSSKDSPFYPFLMAGVVILLVLSLISTSLLCIDSVEKRKREIAMLESLGIAKPSLCSLFCLQNLIAELMALLLSLLLVYPGMACINAVLRSPSVFGVSYDLLSISPYSVLAAAGCALIMTLIATIAPLWKVSKVDILEVLKEG